MKRITVLLLGFKTNYSNKKLNRLNQKLYKMMIDKQPIEKLISFEAQVIRAREKQLLLKKS